MRILITGVSGALGGYVAESFLDHGQFGDQAEIFGVSRITAQATGYTSVNADLLDQTETDALLRDIKPDIVVHAAWITEHGTYWESDENRAWSDASIALAETLADTSDAHLIFAGTCAEYSWTNTPLEAKIEGHHPATLYGREKLRVTKYLMAMTKDKRLSATAARLFFPFSERENPSRVTTYAVSELLSNGRVELRSADLHRDFCHTRKIADAITQMAANRITGLFNVCSGHPMHLGEMIDRIALALGYENAVCWPESDEEDVLVGICNLLNSPTLYSAQSFENDLFQFAKATALRLKTRA